jgi:hypothetical protein
MRSMIIDLLLYINTFDDSIIIFSSIQNDSMTLYQDECCRQLFGSRLEAQSCEGNTHISLKA